MFEESGRKHEALRDRELLRKVLTAQEDERGRLARDLHDEIGQEVTALRFMLKSAKEQCPDFESRGVYPPR